MPNGTGNKFDLDSTLVRKLAKLLSETGLSEIEYAEGDKRIRCATQVSPPAQQTGPIHFVTPETDNKTAPTVAGTPVTAPMVGMVYLAPEPGKPPFVKKGDTVKEGDTLLIIEAMKVMNPIKAPASGVIADIVAADAKPVEFGETLMMIA